MSIEDRITDEIQRISDSMFLRFRHNAMTSIDWNGLDEASTDNVRKVLDAVVSDAESISISIAHETFSFAQEIIVELNRLSDDELLKILDKEPSVYHCIALPSSVVESYHKFRAL